MRPARAASVPLMILLGCSNAFAQTDDFTDWVYERLALVTGAAAGPSSPTKQVETPSIAATSTALVDQSGAPDLIGIATQLFNASRAESGGTPSSFTLSAFAVRTAFGGLDPMRPEVYADGRNWRRFSVSVGRLAADDEQGQPAGQLVGVKVLAINLRDPSHPSNVARLQQSLRNSASPTNVAIAFDALYAAIAARLGPRFKVTDPQDFAEQFLGRDSHAKTLAELTEADLEEIDRVLVERLAPALEGNVVEQQATVQRLRQAPQLAFSYQASLRQELGDDEHLWQGIFDYGVASRMNVSVNVGVSRIDREVLTDETVVRLAGQAQFRLTAEESRVLALLRAQAPLTLSASVSAGWYGEAEDIHKAQVKLTIPMPARLGGISLPISLTVANRTELIDERDVRGQVGFTIDFSALQSALRR